MKLTFTEYLESKEKLKLGLEEAPKVKELYEIEKYCTVPVKINEDIEYIKFKPKDLIEVLWVKEPNNDIPKNFTIIGESDEDIKEFSWSNVKVRSWVKKMARKL